MNKLQNQGTSSVSKELEQAIEEQRRERVRDVERLEEEAKSPRRPAVKIEDVLAGRW